MKSSLISAGKSSVEIIIDQRPMSTMKSIRRWRKDIIGWDGWGDVWYYDLSLWDGRQWVGVVIWWLACLEWKEYVWGCCMMGVYVCMSGYRRDVKITNHWGDGNAWDREEKCRRRRRKVFFLCIESWNRDEMLLRLWESRSLVMVFFFFSFRQCAFLEFNVWMLENSLELEGTYTHMCMSMRLCMYLAPGVLNGG